MLLTLLLVFVICAAGSFVQTLVGFGCNIIIMAILPLFLTTQESIALALISGFVVAIMLAWRFRKKIGWKLVWFPLIFSLGGIILGLTLGMGISSAAMLRLLGALLIVLAVWQFWFASRLKISTGRVSGGIIGVISGGLGALFAISAPPLVLYYGCAFDDKEYFMGTLEIVFVFQAISSISGRMILGMWPWASWMLIPPCLIGLAAGYLPGKMVFDKLDSAKFKIVVYIFMLVAGIYMIASA